MASNTRGLLIIISGPSGVGKDAVINAIRESKEPYFFAVTATTRKQRPDEIDGVHYHFLDKTTFEQMIENEELLEWACVYENFYGIPKKPVTSALQEGRDVIVKVDIQGAATVKQNAPEAISIFISPPSMDELARRLSERKTESEAQLKLRLDTATREMETRSSFDHVVVNPTNQLQQAVQEINSIIKEQKSVNYTKHTVEVQPQPFEVTRTNCFELSTPNRLGDKVLRVRRQRKLRFPRFSLIRRTLSRLR